MPTKRRIDKAGKLDEHKIYELHYGPGTCLLAGCGFWTRGFYWQLPEQEQAVVVEKMKADWQRHHLRVMEAWDARDEHDRGIAREHFADPAGPWALVEFGMPA